MALAYNTKIPHRGLILCIDPANKNSIKPDKNKIDISTWTEGIGIGSAAGWNANGTAAENSRVWGTDPWGNQCLLWESISDGGNDSSGGWATSAFPIDNTKTYRFSVWIRRTVSGTGNTYLGVYALNSSLVNEGVFTNTNTIDTNSYFTTRSYSNIPENEWTLWVGHVRPYDHEPWYEIHPDTGIWNLNGVKILTAANFKWQSTSTHAIHRTYLYYSADPTTTQHWCYPRVDLCDGTEPSLSELLAGKELTLKNLKRGTNDLHLLNAPKHESSVLEFNGTSQYGKSEYIELGPEMTWIYAVNRTESINPYNMFAGQVLPYFGIRSTRVIIFSNNINNIQCTVTSPEIAATDEDINNKWFILTFRTKYDPLLNKTTSTIFKNGESFAESIYDGQQTPNNNSFLLADNRDDVSTDYKFKGKIGYSSIHNCALTDSEIRQYFNALRVRYDI